MAHRSGSGPAGLWTAVAADTVLDRPRVVALGRQIDRRRFSDGAVVGTESAQTIIDRALQLHGGLGATLESEIWHLYQEIRPLRIYEGATEVQKVVIARSLLEGPLEGGRAGG